MTLDELLLSKVKTMNATVGNLKGVDCPVCLNRGYNAAASEGTVVTRECRCMPTRRSIRRIEKSGLAELLEEYTFERYETTNRMQKIAKSAAKRYINDYEGKWFCAFGAVGSGKTHLCTAICGELIKAGFDTRYMQWKDESPKLKAYANDPVYAEMIEPLKRVEVLYIDDFLKIGKRDEFPTRGDIRLAFEIIDARYCNKKLITILSSEHQIEKILDFDEAVGSRIHQRSKGYCLSVVGEGHNWRLK